MHGFLSKSAIFLRKTALYAYTYRFHIPLYHSAASKSISKKGFDAFLSGAGQYICPGFPHYPDRLLRLIFSGSANIILKKFMQDVRVPILNANISRPRAAAAVHFRGAAGKPGQIHLSRRPASGITYSFSPAGTVTQTETRLPPV